MALRRILWRLIILHWRLSAVVQPCPRDAIVIQTKHVTLQEVMCNTHSCQQIIVLGCHIWEHGMNTVCRRIGMLLKEQQACLRIECESAPRVTLSNGSSNGCSSVLLQRLLLSINARQGSWGYECVWIERALHFVSPACNHIWSRRPAFTIAHQVTLIVVAFVRM
jgi:hypothetical protein